MYHFPPVRFTRLICSLWRRQGALVCRLPPGGASWPGSACGWVRRVPVGARCPRAHSTVLNLLNTEMAFERHSPNTLSVRSSPVLECCRGATLSSERQKYWQVIERPMEIPKRHTTREKLWRRALGQVPRGGGSGSHHLPVPRWASYLLPREADGSAQAVVPGGSCVS